MKMHNINKKIAVPLDLYWAWTKNKFVSGLEQVTTLFLKYLKQNQYYNSLLFAINYYWLNCQFASRS